MPLPSSETDTETWRLPGAALTLMVDDSSECLAALVSRLPSTWAMRDLSAMTQGRSGGMSMRRLCPCPPIRKALPASPVSAARSVGSGETGRVPVSMRATSSRSAISTRIRSVCSKMIRWNWRISAGCMPEYSSSSADTEPLTVARGVRSSWLTIARNSARSRSISSSAVRSCRVTTKLSTSPSSDHMGVAFISAVTLLPSGTWKTTSSARTVSPALSASATESSCRETSRPSARRIVITSRRCSGGRSGVRRASIILTASRLNDTGAPVFASKTATPTGDVSISASRSFLARCSSRYLRALAMTIAAWEANISRVSSSSWLNSAPRSFSATKMLPTRSPRWKTGAARNGKDGPTGMGGLISGRPIDLMWPSRSGPRSGSCRLLK